ncbi:potassium voltage-gated channel subfamily A member 10-like [Haliotis asinina]|uniref:potassium voltage-gated channel subfamily A member 10-like n=1 Tax=Haliotis asinina TaxID=109174 RepID=UPI00353220B8
MSRPTSEVNRTVSSPESEVVSSEVVSSELGSSEVVASVKRSQEHLLGRWGVRDEASSLSLCIDEMVKLASASGISDGTPSLSSQQAPGVMDRCVSLLPLLFGTLENVHWKEYFGNDLFDKNYDKIRLADKEFDPLVMKEITQRHNKTAGEILGNFSLPTNVHVKNDNMELVSYICIAFFTLELMLRLFCCPNIFRFFRSLLNIIDVLAVVSALVKVVVEQLSAVEKFQRSYLDIHDRQGMLVLRVLRLFHLTKHITGARVLVYAFKSSSREVGFMALLVVITSIVFGTVEYYVDSERMQSIPEACWWAVITMTTVGYGDVTPSNAFAKCVGVICMGILVLAITMPLFVNNFITFYSIAKETSDQAKTKISNSEPRIAFSTVQPVVFHPSHG